MGKRKEMISPYKCSHISQLIENMRYTAGGFKWDEKHFKCWNFGLENICTDHQLNICNPKPILWATYTGKVSDFQGGAAKPVPHFYVVAHSSSFTLLDPSYISYPSLPILSWLTSGLIQTYIPVISILKSTACFYCCKFSWPFSKQRSTKKQFIDSLGSRISRLPSTPYSKLFAPAHRLILYLPACLHHLGYRLSTCLAFLYISLEPDLSCWKLCPGPRSKEQKREFWKWCGYHWKTHYLRPVVSGILSPTDHVLENRIYTQRMLPPNWHFHWNLQ